MSYLRKMISKKVEIKLVNIYTSEPFQGNPVAVIPYGDSIEEDIKIAIINELNVSEGVFIGDSTDNKSDFKIAVYTKTGEIEANYQSIIAAAYVMISEKEVLLKDSSTNVITIESQDEVFPLLAHSKSSDSEKLMVLLDLSSPPEFRRVDFDSSTIAATLSLSSDDIRPDVMMQAVKMKKWSLVLPLKNKAAFEKITLDQQALLSMIKENDLKHLCLVNISDLESGSKINSRIYRINDTQDAVEEIITGDCTCCISAFLFEQQLLPIKGSKIAITYLQSKNNGRTSEIAVEMDIINETIKEMYLGGQAVIVLDGKIQLTPDY